MANVDECGCMQLASCMTIAAKERILAVKKEWIYVLRPRSYRNDLRSTVETDLK